MFGSFGILGLKSAVRLQKSSHPNGAKASVSLLSNILIRDGALFWVHPNGLCFKVLSYIN